MSAKPPLWINGDPTDGRVLGGGPTLEDPPAHGPHDRDPHDRPLQHPQAPPPPPRKQWPGRLIAALGGGFIAGAIVLGGLAVTGNLDAQETVGNDAPPAVASAGGVSSKDRGDVGRIFAATSPGVVSIRAGQAGGTGFLVDKDGTIVTNAHVVAGNDEVQVQFDAGPGTVSARVMGADASSDLAVLKVDAGAVSKVRPLALADSRSVQVGDLAVAIGSPFGLEQTATAGIVSATGREIQAPDGFSIDEVIQTDAPINPGNSGGPLLDARGRVIGVNSQIRGSSSGGNVGIGFAVPANAVREVLPALKRGQAVRHPYIGVSTSPASTTGSGGARVERVTGDSPASRAGIQQGDVVKRVGGREVKDPGDIASAISGRSPGERLEIELERGGSSQTVTVELGTRPSQAPGTSPQQGGGGIPPTPGGP
jgi:putative serine protease PepD